MATSSSIVIEHYLRARERSRKRLIGVPTLEVYTDYVAWMKMRLKLTGHKGLYAHPQVRAMFTFYVNEIQGTKSVARRINGKLVPVFWDENATRLDLGSYLD